MVIDIHTHIFPPKLAPHAIKALENSAGAHAFLNGTKEDLIKSMRENGIDISVNMPVASRADQVHSINNYAIEVNNEGDTTGLYSFGACHPLNPDMKEELRRLKSAGIKGIKIHPDFQGLYLDDEAVVRIMEYAAELGLIILIHCGMDPSFPDIHRSTPKRLAGILPRLSGAKIIAAHMGGYGYMDDVEDCLVGKNVYIDTSFTIGKFDEKQILRILQNHNPDKILFGTDSPWDDQKNALKLFKELPLSDELKEKILWKNSKNLLEIL